MTDEEILKAYAQLGTIKATAEAAGVGTQLIRRILVTHGWHTNETHSAVSTLSANGLSPDEIASHLQIGRTTVFVYLPYTKGRYMADDPTANALKIRKTKEKAKMAGKPLPHLCRDCGTEIEFAKKRGGPPQLCPECKRKREEKKIKKCIVCGAEFSIAGKRGKPPLKCPECSLIAQMPTSDVPVRKLRCIDCGAELECKGRGANLELCPECNKKRKRAREIASHKKRRERLALEAAQNKEDEKNEIQ